MTTHQEWKECKSSIGGWSMMSFEQIGFALKAKLKEDFPINEVPDHLVGHIDRIISDLSSIQRKIEFFVDEVAKNFTEKE